MKQFYALACLTLCAGSSLFAQELAEQESKPLAFKFSPAGLTFGKLTIGTEYNVVPKNSVTFSIGVPMAKKKQVNYDGNQSDISSKAFSVMAGYRHYAGRKYMSGFYVEPYVKYVNHQGSGMITSDLNGQEVVFDTHTKYSGIGVGAQLGVQMIISRSIVIDLFLIGPEANSAKFSLLATDKSNINWSAADKNQLEADINDLLTNVPLVGNKMNVAVDEYAKTAAIDYKGFMPGFRVGGSVGIRF